MFKPVQFSSQYTYDVLYRVGQAGRHQSANKLNVGKTLVPSIMRSTAVSGVCAQGITYNDELRLMVDDQRGGDANLARQAMKGAEDVPRVTQAMLADESLGLSAKPAAEVEALLTSPIKRAEYLLAHNGALHAPEKTDHLKFYFTRGESGEPVLDQVELQTRSNRLLNLAQEAPAKEAASAAEEGGEEKAPEKNPFNPLAALQAAFGLPLNKISVTPFAEARVEPGSRRLPQ